MSVEDVHTLTGAYAVDALDAEERRFFESHLASCDACREEVRELRETAAVLGGAAAERAPAALRRDVLAAIDTVPQQRRGGPGAHRAQRPPLLGLAAAIAFVAVAGLGVVGATLQSRLDEAQQRSVLITSVLSAPDARITALAGPGSARGRVVSSAARGTTVVVAERLPEIGSDEVFELWLIDDDGPRPAGLFRPDDGGTALHLVDEDLSGVAAVAVTVEPEGGSPQPTSDPFLLSEV